MRARRTERVARTERLLLEREEHSVYELDILEVIVDHVVEFEPLRDINSVSQIASRRGRAKEAAKMRIANALASQSDMDV